ncbi:uncharacterized protein BP01DRAFT_204022 [Aspergillus saccharolyticus JOP 1030-1]|uniref:CRIB domain-containing protein n=1 Tax=Aspergillus saccharolyticus JOP 1030-1 TaxID=1450539 RepID=A0A318Z072_9EURO|nr:hypothetical protein BP01DRAFT_204022 [Aspergillus saccharolyticus JOP 1030-1]PYH40655.1 hypothetical protein BP01DRAFT_204022 [Aspergillus saccharolyticus JOP 1030-1]
MSQQDLDRAYGRAPSNGSPEQYSVHTRSRSTAHAQSPKRLSVLSGRSRSNTTNSTTSSSRRSPGSSMTSVDGPSLPFYEDRASSSAGFRYERSESVTKSILSRGSRILRRRGSKFHIVSTLDEEDEVDREKSRFEVSDLFSRHHKPRQSDAHDQLKSLISDPFDFHHLTHTSPSQFQSLEKARETDLVTEFSAIRASQRPVTNLKGIQADDLHFRDFSSEDLNQYRIAIAENDIAADTIPVSPPASPDGSSSISPKQHDIRGRPESRVFENFSRPVPRAPKGPDMATSPLRASSSRLASSPELPEPASRAIDELLGLSSQPTYPEHVYSQDGDEDDDVCRGSSWSQLNLQDMFAVPTPHALTTDIGKERLDARASSMSLTTLSSDLEGVPEEEEGEEVTLMTSDQWFESELPGDMRSSQTITGFSQLPLVEIQSTSTAAPSTSGLSLHIMQDLTRKFSEALGSPTLPQERPIPEVPPGIEQAGSEIARRRSLIAPRAIHETLYDSWEADIDYCYQHAAESNSNFDWTRNSIDEPKADVMVGADIGPNHNDSMVSFSRPSATAVITTDLDSIPSFSEVSSHVAVTPSTADYDSSVASLQRDSDYFRPVRFEPALIKTMNPESLYEDYLTADAESDRHFSYYSQQGAIQPIEHSISPRSSFSPISKCNSQESLILSRAASIVRKHRSSVSTASVPELVHSLANSRELISTEQMLSLTSEYTAGGQPDSPHHRQTKSLAREAEAQRLYHTESDASFSPVGSGPAIISSIHDRAKSTSEVEAAPLVAAATSKVAPRRKGRASYSLFPAAAN